ncbi:hypothetical protein GCM10010357_07930 [Streptomyces luteireticuli]|uniref:Uncharacterized protein n=1 Tax=Streptomyces luteireticuli TaxID=173858 RepID=A0ABP3I476_9ACTN
MGDGVLGPSNLRGEMDFGVRVFGSAEVVPVNTLLYAGISRGAGSAGIPPTAPAPTGQVFSREFRDGIHRAS